MTCKIIILRVFLFFFSLYTIFQARAPVLNSSQYFELVKFNPQASDGLEWTAGKQAAFQFAALILTLALAIFGGLLTGKLIVMALQRIAFYIETSPDKTIMKMASLCFYWEVIRWVPSRS